MCVVVQLFNELNARKIQDELNMFSGLLKSHVFMYVFAVVIGLQVTFPYPAMGKALLS